jgi:tRNA threonylcarbamoyladenosine biosynthesis protein TsaE
LDTKFVSQSIGETRKFARELAGELPRGSIILLSGDLGAGKTEFVRGFVSRWKLDNLVGSPTFTIMNEYASDKVRICHFDLYRLSSPEELVEIGFTDFVSEADFVFIEWPQIAVELLEGNLVKINAFLGSTENERIFDIKKD